ncbi:MAG TPA: copper chaperone PCu(A)C [Acetobacteraceae bacterium]|jgi:copper(I)-binding protein|nr:copper chaperone PCu(A)C [Acetobacteraceae bacterium]
MSRFLATVLILLPAMALAGSNPIKVDQVWSRAAIAGHEGVVYLSITNSGPTDTLTGASTPIAAMAGLHQTINDNGVMKMRSVPSMPIEPGRTVTLAPQGTHIMLMDLKQSLAEGDSFPITLTFEKAGTITAEAKVAKAGATVAPMSGMSMPVPGRKP